MSLQIEKLEKNMAKLTIEVSAEELDKALEAAFQKNKGKITKELQMPIHDDIDINRCKYNVSKSKTDRRFKKWLMYQLDHIEKF